jgi:hypothetical protein
MISLKVNSRSACARDASADVARIRAHVAPGVDVDADVHASLAPGAASRVLSLLLSELFETGAAHCVVSRATSPMTRRPGKSMARSAMLGFIGRTNSMTTADAAPRSGDG